MQFYNVIIGPHISACAYFMLYNSEFLVLITFIAGNLIGFSHRKKTYFFYVPKFDS